jgi:hypothetical protein
LGTTAYLFWTGEREIDRAEAAARTFDEGARTALLTARDLRAAQQAYVASGQGADFWFSRSTAIQSDLKGRTAALRSQATGSGAVGAFEDALGLLQDFEQMDGRAREQVRARRLSAAADLIFADGFDLTRKISAAIEQGRAAELASDRQGLAALRGRQLFSLGAAAVTALLIVLLLLPVRERERIVVADPIVAPAPLPALDSRPELTLAAPIEEEEREWSAARPAVPSPAPEIVPVPAPLPPPLPPPPSPPRIDLAGVARLCGELARISDTRALPGLLERTASLLDASGIVLWIADPDGRELAPIVTFGYSPQTVTRLGTIPKEAENATAAAFRTSLLQTVDADAVSGGALAAPLVTPGGCVGVMAAEIRNDGEREDIVLAAAGIVAAQLATLVGPPSSRSLKADVASG